jgi:hypothetical protein
VTSRVAVERNAYVAPLQTKLKAIDPDTLLLNRFSFVFTSPADALLRLKRGEIALIVEPLPAGRFAYHFDPRNEVARTQYLLSTRNSTKPRAGRARSGRCARRAAATSTSSFPA